MSGCRGFGCGGDGGYGRRDIGGLARIRMPFGCRDIGNAAVGEPIGWEDIGVKAGEFKPGDSMLAALIQSRRPAIW